MQNNDDITHLIKELTKELENEPLSLVDNTAKELISIERQYFYGDSSNNERLSRARSLLYQNAKKYYQEKRG